MGIEAAFMVPHPPVIIPKIGKGEEGKISKTKEAYEEVANRIGVLKPDTIVVISSHQTMYADYFHISPRRSAKGNFEKFKVSSVNMAVKYDTEFVDQLVSIAQSYHVPAGTKGEKDKMLDYGTMIPLVFVNQKWKEYKLVRIGLSGLPFTRHYELGKCIKDAAKKLGRKTVVIASGDLSHRMQKNGPYGYVEEGPKYDEKVMNIMEHARFDELFDFEEGFLAKAGECGHRTFLVLAGTLDQAAVQAEKLSYEGPLGVGYGVCAYRVMGENEDCSYEERYIEREEKRIEKRKEKEDDYVSLARTAIEEYMVSGESTVTTEQLPDELCHNKAGAFVLIKEAGKLRGCIGTIEPMKDSLAEEIMCNAMNAAFHDPRYAPIRKDELKRLEIIVDVIGKLEEIDSNEMLDIHRYGVIVSRGRKKGFLLPNQSGLETVEQQVAIARKNAGIKPKDKVKVERFEVVRHI